MTEFETVTLVRIHEQVLSLSSLSILQLLGARENTPATLIDYFSESSIVQVSLLDPLRSRDSC